MATPVGGMSDLYHKISKITATRAAKNSIESRVVVAFVVSIEGEISGRQIVKNIAGADFAQQLLKVVTELK